MYDDIKGNLSECKTKRVNPMGVGFSDTLARIR